MCHYAVNKKTKARQDDFTRTCCTDREIYFSEYLKHQRGFWHLLAALMRVFADPQGAAVSDWSTVELLMVTSPSPIPADLAGNMWCLSVEPYSHCQPWPRPSPRPGRSSAPCTSSLGWDGFPSTYRQLCWASLNFLNGHVCSLVWLILTLFLLFCRFWALFWQSAGDVFHVGSVCGFCHRLHGPASLRLLPEGLEAAALQPIPALPDLCSHVVVRFHPLCTTLNPISFIRGLNLSKIPQVWALIVSVSYVSAVL